MKLKDALKFMLVMFFAATTAQVFFIATMSLVYNEMAEIDTWYLYKILFVALMSTLPILIFVFDEKRALRKEVIIRKAAHFIITPAVVFFLLSYLEMIDATNAVAVIILFLFLYIPAYTIQEIRRE